MLYDCLKLLDPTFKAVANQVHLKTILHYDFMLLCDSWEAWVRRAGSFSWDCSFAKTENWGAPCGSPVERFGPHHGGSRYKNVAYLPAVQVRAKATPVLLLQVTTSENHVLQTSSWGRGGNLPKASQNSVQLSRNGLFCLRRQYHHVRLLPLGSLAGPDAGCRRLR